MAEETAEAEVTKKRSKKAVLIPALVLVLGLGGGAFAFLGGGKDSSAAGKETTTTTAPHGPIVTLDPITLNLTDGHVLKVGLALELAAEPKDKHMLAVVKALSGGGGGHGSSSSSAETSPLGGLESKALDLAITKLGGKSFEELSSPEGRAAAKKELDHDIAEAYHHDVVKIYFTNFVMS